MDSNVLIDILFGDPVWSEWSRSQLSQSAARGPMFINDVIFAEICVGFQTAAQVETSCGALGVERIALAPEALFLAVSAFTAYRRNTGAKSNVLPDFFIGAQARVEGWTLLTRDARRYRTYFPQVELITPG